MAKKVLIVEDYEDSREFMKLLFRTYDCEVFVAANGKEAVEIVRKEAPDLILMDIALPEMDGLTATEIIRNSPDSAEIPIVAITAHANLLTQEAIDAGCNEVISKPLDFVSLEPLLAQYLKSE